jgi:hypothetical protein
MKLGMVADSGRTSAVGIRKAVSAALMRLGRNILGRCQAIVLNIEKRCAVLFEGFDLVERAHLAPFGPAFGERRSRKGTGYSEE